MHWAILLHRPDLHPHGYTSYTIDVHLWDCMQTKKSSTLELSYKKEQKSTHRTPPRICPGTSPQADMLSQKSLQEGDFHFQWKDALYIGASPHGL